MADTSNNKGMVITSKRLAVFAIIILTLLLLSACAVFIGSIEWKFCSSERHFSCKCFDNKRTNSSKSYSDSIIQCNKDALKDSLITRIKLRNDYLDNLDIHCDYEIINQSNLIKRQDELINDIRQETNNNLDKMSTWLSFWIAIMALLGTLLPIALSFIDHYRDEKLRDELSKRINDEIMRMKEDYSKQIDSSNQSIEFATQRYKASVSGLQNTVTDHIKNIQKAFNESIVDVKRNSLETDITSLENGIKSKTLLNIREGDVIEKRMLTDIISKLKEISNMLDAPETFTAKMDKELILISSLLSINRILHAYMISKNPYKIYLANKCRDKITKILSDMTKSSLDNTLSSVKNLCNDLSTLIG